MGRPNIYEKWLSINLENYESLEYYEPSKTDKFFIPIGYINGRFDKDVAVVRQNIFNKTKRLVIDAINRNNGYAISELPNGIDSIKDETIRSEIIGAIFRQMEFLTIDSRYLSAGTMAQSTGSSFFQIDTSFEWEQQSIEILVYHKVIRQYRDAPLITDDADNIIINDIVSYEYLEASQNAQDIITDEKIATVNTEATENADNIATNLSLINNVETIANNNTTNIDLNTTQIIANTTLSNNNHTEINQILNSDDYVKKQNLNDYVDNNTIIVVNDKLEATAPVERPRLLFETEIPNTTPINTFGYGSGTWTYNLTNAEKDLFTPFYDKLIKITIGLTTKTGDYLWFTDSLNSRIYNMDNSHSNTFMFTGKWNGTRNILDFLALNSTHQGLLDLNFYTSSTTLHTIEFEASVIISNASGQTDPLEMTILVEQLEEVTVNDTPKKNRENLDCTEWYNKLLSKKLKGKKLKEKIEEHTNKCNN